MKDTTPPTGSSEQGEVPPLTLTLDVHPRRGASGEPVFAELALANTGDRACVVNARMTLNDHAAPDPFRDVSFSFATPPDYEERRDFHVNIGHPRPEDFVELDAGEAVVRSYELTRYYTLDVVGAYGIRAVYTNVYEGPDPSRPAWVGQIESDCLVFERTS